MLKTICNIKYITKQIYLSTAPRQNLKYPDLRNTKNYVAVKYIIYI
jgi:hypothetical protein